VIVNKANRRPFGSPVYWCGIFVALARLRICGLFNFGVDAGFNAAVHDGFAETVGEFVGELVGLVAAVDVDGFSGGVNDDVAVAARSEVFFHFGEEFGFDLAIEVVG